MHIKSLFANMARLHIAKKNQLEKKIMVVSHSKKNGIKKRFQNYFFF